MRVCLICEGSYPYVSGGVSGWVQMLCQNLSDVQFIIWTIATTREEMSEYKYSLPPNIMDVRTIYIGENTFHTNNRRVKLSETERRVLRELVAYTTDRIDWKRVRELVKKYKAHLADVLMGEDFYAICLEEYNKTEKAQSFLEFLWNFRGMYFPLINILSDDLVKADIYHSLSTGYAGILGSAASYIEKKPYILSEHGIYTREREEDIIRSDWVKGGFKELWIDFFKKLSTIAYQQADVVTSLFDTNKSLQIELYCPEEKIELISNGVAVEEYRRLTPKKKENGRFCIGTLLRVVPIKDVKTMLLAFAYVREQLPEAELLILGSYDENPEYYEECQALIKALQIGNIRFYGQVDVKEYMADMDLLLLSSISEGQPLAVLEGLAAGIPFVCTNVGDCKGLLEGKEGDSFGKAGLIVPVMDSKAMAEAVLYLAGHPEELHKMGEAGRKRIKQYYNKENFLEQYRRLYQRLGEA